MSLTKVVPSRRPGLRPYVLTLALAVATVATVLIAPSAEAASLSPTRSGLLRQVRQAKAHDYTFLQRGSDVQRFVKHGYLVRVPGNRDYLVKDTVRYPYARPQVKLFVERLSSQYRSACGERLVVTSLVRPKREQPRNASPLSVHPTGMAMDLRVPSNRRCRTWIERVLVQLEDKGVLEAARERRPPHYHVVLFPKPYADYVARKTGDPSVRSLGQVAKASSSEEVRTYRVRSGDSLWTIARKHNTSVRSIQQANGLRTTRIKPKQVLKIPVSAK